MRLDRVDVANLRAAGLTVVELPGWLTNGRPGSHDPKGILCHHTAASQDGRTYAEWMADKGRDDLPAPLAQIGLARTGVVYMQAAGRANHAGRCKRARPWLSVFPGRNYGDGNTQMIGIEAMNTGGAEGWSKLQKAAYVTVCAVLARRRGWDEEHVLGHKETSLEGKPDPSFDMNAHRRAIAAQLSQEDEVTPAQMDQLAALVVSKLLGADVIKAPTPSETNPYWGVNATLEWTLRRSSQSFAELGKLRADVAGLTAMVVAANETPGISQADLESIRRAAADAVTAQIDKEIAAATVTLETPKES